MILSQFHPGKPKIEKEMNIMEKTPDITDINGNAFNQESPPQEAAANLGALTLEMKRLKLRYRKYTKRTAELTKLAIIQEEVIHRMLDSAIEEPEQPKKPHLTIVK